MEEIRLKKSDLESNQVQNIFLTGFMGTGKSTVGKMLAEDLNWKFIDTDQKAEKIEKNSVKNIIEQKGLAYFRKVEKRVIQEICKNKNQVVALGGGAIIHATNKKRIQASGVLIALTAYPQTVFKRVQFQSTRPLIDAKSSQVRLKKIKSLLLQRMKYYQQAHYRVKTDFISPALVKQKIMKSLFQKFLISL